MAPCVFAALAIFALLSSASGLLEPMPLPAKLRDCYDFKSFEVNVTQMPARKIQDFCIRQYLYEEAAHLWAPNITSSGVNYINSLLRQIFSEMHEIDMAEQPIKDTKIRRKRQVPGMRIRQEVRTLQPDQWMRFTQCLQRLKTTSVEPGTGRSAYDTIAVLHSGSVLANAHGGPAFLGFHRLYLLLIETACGVSLPYWDSSLDFAMDDPTTSVFWSALYVGNGDGDVVTGPFRDWRTILDTPLVRNIGSGESSLMTKEGIALVLSRRRLSEISEPRQGMDALYSLEGHHNGPHVWVDGWMARPQTAAYDPVFFLHHCFVDYVYEVFRQQQAWQHGIDPQTDYPVTNVRRGHEWYRLVEFLPFFRPIRNLDALSNYFSRLVRYAPAPECPSCGNSRHIMCDTMRQICVSTMAPELESSEARDAAVVAATRVGGVAPPASVPASSGIMTASKVLAHARGPLPAGPKFNSSPFRDIRNRNPELLGAPEAAQVAFAGDETRQKARAAAAATDPSLLQVASQQSGRRKKRSAHPSSTKNFNKKSKAAKPYQNTFMIDGVSDIKRWAFISVQILYERPTAASYANHLPGKKGNQTEIFANLSGKLKSNKLATYHKCNEVNASFSKVYVSTDGLDYVGNYKDVVTIDETKPVSSATSYVGIKHPRYGEGKVLVTAYDSCGRSCRPACLVAGSSPAKYKPCSGAFKISLLSPKMYSDTYGEAIVGAWDLGNSLHGEIVQENSPITFVCDYDNAWPWQHY